MQSPIDILILSFYFKIFKYSKKVYLLFPENLNPTIVYESPIKNKK